MVLPTAYFGNIEYFYQLLKNETVIIDYHETYQKQSYRSRCTIVTSNGLLNLSLPIERPKGKASLISEVTISQNDNWQKDHKKALESAYRRTPYYEFYIDDIHDILDSDESSLIKLNARLTQYLIDKIGLTVKLQKSRAQTALIENDMRVLLHPKKDNSFTTYHYIQTFEEKHGFHGNLSILDLLFNEGPNAISIIAESGY
jgi:hypothetical protein